MRTPVNRVAGFTIIELAIVMVIIGLLVGGVLLGKDMIDAAHIQKQISQIDEIKLAHQTFKIKYNALAGDLCANAQAVGLACGNASGRRDNGAIEDFQGNTTYIFGVAYEPMYFFGHLADAGLIDKPPIPYTCGSTATFWDPTFTMFAPYLHPSGGMLAFTHTGTTWLYVGMATYPTAPCNFGIQAGLPYSANGVMTPQQAFAIDKKLDDGIPATGNIRATIRSNSNNNFIDGTIDNLVGVCVVDATSLAYNVTNGSKDCRLMIKL